MMEHPNGGTGPVKSFNNIGVYMHIDGLNNLQAILSTVPHSSLKSKVTNIWIDILLFISELPYEISMAKMVEDSSGGAILVGGFRLSNHPTREYLSNQILYLANTESQWEILPQKLNDEMPIYNAVFLIPDELTNCSVKGADPYNNTAYTSDDDRASPVQYFIRIVAEYADYVYWNLSILYYVVVALCRSLISVCMSNLF